jgi:hypothetical protein
VHELVRTAPRRAIYACKTVVARSPTLALPIARLRGQGHGEPFDPGVDIVIEGYPRSGNSFSVHAFRVAQDRPVRIAHHLHAPAQIIAATRAHVPALMLIRDPEDAVLEFVIAKGYVSIRQALHGYVRFYAPLLRYRGRFVVGSFREVTTDFGEVIAHVNEAFGTAFHEFEHTDENVRSSFEAIEADWATRLPPGGEAFERRVSRPSEARDELKAQLREAYRGDALALLRERAEGLQAAFVA